MNLQIIKMSISSGLLKDIGQLLLRTVITLVLTGAYLHYLLEINSTALNIAWLLVMTACTAVCARRRARAGNPRLVLPLFAGILAGVAVAGLLFMAAAGLWRQLPDARYLVPVAGLMLSTIMTACTAGIKSYCTQLTADTKKYNMLVGNGATHGEAAAPFVRKALESSIRPMAEGTTVMQLAAMPAMYGMIIGGCSPVTAMKYQLMILIASLMASVIALVLTIYLADKTFFDNFGRIRRLKGMAAAALLSAVLTACTAGNTGRPLMGGDISARAADGEHAENSTPHQDSGIQELELPAFAGGETILRRTGYTTCYDTKNRIPRWVAWRLTADHVTGPYKRKGQMFTEDEDVPAPRATHYDYIRSGYDRGHLCPSGDCKWSEKAQAESFLLTNICPQNPNLNRGDWNETENLCREWATTYGEVYVVCGPILLKGRHKTIGRNKITVPEAFFKVVLRTNPDTCAIGFIYRNTDGDRPRDSYVNSVDQVERITGLDFFHKLPDGTESRTEARADLNEW